MPECKGVGNKYFFVQAMLITAILMMVCGFVLFLNNYYPEKSQMLVWYGALLVLLCLPVSLVFALIYWIESMMGQKKFITRIETCKWKKHKIVIMVKKDKDMPDLHDTFVYVDNELVASTNARQDGEKDVVEGGFVHEARKVNLKVQQKEGEYVLGEYFAPQGPSYPRPTIYFEVNIDGDILAAGNPGMSRRTAKYWSFVCLLVSLLLFTMGLFPPKPDYWRDKNFGPFYVGFLLLLAAYVLWNESWNFKSQKRN
jgi:hypothetical protein